jgi:CBS domain-containing protein
MALKGGMRMKVRDLMTQPAIQVAPTESVEVAARTLTHYNIGALPVCTGDGRLCGVVTDRDLVTRCMASGRKPSEMTVREVMTGKVEQAQPDMDAAVAAHLMGRLQVRRLPVVENGKLCGMLSLGDLAKREQSIQDAADALSDITANLSDRTNW